MIEFYGTYYRKKTSPPQSVLVQFDGVLLRIWNISAPFHCILSSDVYQLPFTPGHRRRRVKLPDGSRIETDNVQALALLKQDRNPGLPIKPPTFGVQRHTALVFSLLVTVLTTGLLAYCLFIR